MTEKKKSWRAFVVERWRAHSALSALCPRSPHAISPAAGGIEDEPGKTRSSWGAVRSKVPAIAAFSTARVSIVGLRSRPSKSALGDSPGQSASTA
jgi:hypothetical protein